MQLVRSLPWHVLDQLTHGKDKRAYLTSRASPTLLATGVSKADRASLLRKL